MENPCGVLFSTPLRQGVRPGTQGEKGLRTEVEVKRDDAGTEETPYYSGD